MSQKLIMCRGLPWSGKSTWAKEYVKSTAKSVRINNDDLRASFYGRKFSKEDEGMITQLRNSIIRDYVVCWYTVVVDNTNLNPIHESSLRDLVVDIKWIIFEIKEFAVDVQTCIERDKLRGADSVWEKVIRDMAKRWNYYPEPPREFDKVVQSFWEPCIIVDIDWTIAKMGDRNPYDYTKVHLDTPHNDIILLIDMIKSIGKYKVVLCSGRKDDCREETIKWLSDVGFHYDELLMRKSDDNRKDSIVKYEILVNDIIPKYFVEYVFDDRNQVVKMWREAGLRCLQVAPWDF